MLCSDYVQSVILVLTVFVVRIKYNNAMFGLRSKCYIGTDCFCR